MGQNLGLARGCKIIKARQFFVVVTGMFGQFVPGGFNAYTLLQDIAKQQRTAIAVANRFEKVAPKPFQKYLREFQKKDPKDFERACNNKPCLQVRCGSEARMAAIRLACVLPANARLPVAISYSTAPSTKMSAWVEHTDTP